jgi:recombination associated protein RdgC
MNFARIKQLNEFLGKEFLTWLWYKIEISSGLISLPKHKEIEIYFDRRIVLEKKNNKDIDKIAYNGNIHGATEIKSGLASGKQVKEARIKVGRGSTEWSFILKADNLSFSSLKLSQFPGEKQDTEGLFYENMSKIEEVTAIIDELFDIFVNIRTSNKWEEEIPKIREFILQK